MRLGFGFAAVAMIALALPACQHRVPVPLQTQALTPSHQSLALRRIQSRRFETGDEAKILNACAGLLQDLGFIISESSAQAGLLVASKDRSTADPELKSVITIGAQHIRISIVTTPLKGKKILVRVTFQRVFWSPHNQFTRVETINDPAIYQDFFNKLSQSIFLEAHQI